MKTSILIATSVLLSIYPSLAHADLVINVSGGDGSNASHGRNAMSSGGDGAHAGRSTPGADAGNIDIRLQDLGDGRVSVTGTHDRTFNAGTAGQIILRANGGRGGNGGNGGDGAQGYTGSHGGNATRYSRGGDGGRGGPGGDGGNGSSGSNGGNAGTVTVTVKEKDMHLLYLLATPEVRGGDAGIGGRNGRGGSGGYGGPGGSSYSWQEPYTSTCSESYTDTCHGSKTVSGSNGTSTTVGYDYSCTKTRSVSCTKYRTESNPGGSTGPSGYSGHDGRASISNGYAGSNGRYKFVVEYKDGRIVSYDRAFDLVVTSFNLATDFSDTFAQPGEKLKISSITIANRGGMPSPTMTPIRLRADSDAGGALSTDASPIDVRQSIPAGGSIVVEGALATEILRSFLPLNETESAKHRGGPKKEFNIGVSNEIVGINRFPNRLATVKHLEVRHPVSISRVLGKRSIGQGENYLFRWAVDNHSKYELGSASGGHRQIRFVSSFTFNTAEKSSSYFLETKSGGAGGTGVQDLNSVPGRSSKGAQESPLMWAKFGFTKDANVLDEGTLRIVVEIEDPYIKGKWVQVDVAHFPIKVGNAFSMTPGSNVLLVTSPQTTASELSAWKSVVATAGRKLDVWDVGIMGAPDIGRGGIAEHYAGGTVVILNDLFKQPGEEAVPADAMFKLAPTDFVELAAKHHIGIFIFDRTGSYKARAGGYGSFTGRTSESPMLVAVKVNETNFKSPDFIKSKENLVNLCMSLSFTRKLEEFMRAGQSDSAEAAGACLEAIVADLTTEQIAVQSSDNDTKEKLTLLSKVLDQGIMASTDGSIESNLSGRFPSMVLDLIGRMWFLVESDIASKHTEALLKEMVFKLFHARDGWFDSKSEKASYKRVIGVIEKQVNKLKKDAHALEDAFVTNDKSRFFKFPRKWNGNYYRQAAVSLILRPVFDRTYTHKLDLFEVVLEKERQALPAFN